MGVSAGAALWAMTALSAATTAGTAIAGKQRSDKAEDESRREADKLSSEQAKIRQEADTAKRDAANSAAENAMSMRKKAAAAKGFSSTMLTGGAGVPNTGQKKLLGE
jgi:hypothetical protein